VGGGGRFGLLNSSWEILLNLPIHSRLDSEVKVGGVMQKENHLEILQKFLMLPQDQRMLFEHLLEDCIAGQVRLLDEMERDEVKKDFDDDVPW
jgi:hypothetical protein